VLGACRGGQQAAAVLPLSFNHVNVPYSGIVPVTSKAVARVRVPVCHTPLDFQWIFVCATDWPPAQAVLIADSYGTIPVLQSAPFVVCCAAQCVGACTTKLSAQALSAMF
jgi:hypothetical protein